MSSQPDRDPPKPRWLRRPLPRGGLTVRLERGLRERRLHTICEQGCCPNMGECFGRGVATFLIMGAVCTRNCAFCAVSHGKTVTLDPDEPARVAAEVAGLGLKFVVITSVTRDDLPDGGAGHFAATIGALRDQCPGVGVEVLIPDLLGSAEALAKIVHARPEVLAHNVETVPRLYQAVRPQAIYQRSLELLARTADTGGPAVQVKSGLMVGLGETADEVGQTMADLHQAGCSILTIGQYLRPSQAHHRVVEYIEPAVFEEYERMARDLGFRSVASGPFVRSSYLAEHYYQNLTG